MAHIHRNIFIHGLADVLGKSRSGKIMITHKPLFSDKRKKHPADIPALRQAATYANFARTQEVYLEKETATGVSAYTIAITDWFGGPRVLQIDVDAWTGEPGQTIRLKARDNVAVLAINVLIRDEQGNVLEAGNAVQSETGSAWWDYTTQSRLKMSPFPSVEAIAWDLPGNRDSFVIS